MAGDDVERWSTLQAWMYSLLSANPRSNRMIVDLAAPTSADNVVDIGCGAGAAVRRAAATGAHATGIDPSAAMIRRARRRSRRAPAAHFAEGDAADLPFADDAVSIAWAIATYHHWPDHRAGLVEVRRVLRPGGRLLIGERRLRRAGGHGLAPGEADDTAALLEDLGYGQVAVRSHRLLLATMLVVVAYT